MSRAFAVRRLWADLVTPDGLVVVLYLGWFSVAGIRSRYAAVETHHPDGRREVVQGLPPEGGPASRPDGGWEYRVTTGDGSVFTLVHHGKSTPWHPEPQVSPLERWWVTVPRARATARWTGGPELEGTGYADWVELDRPPVLLGLRLMRWGRIHLPDRTIVFDAVDHTDGSSWARTAEWDTEGGLLAVHDDVDERVALSPLRTLHDGSPTDPVRFPSLAQRLLTRLGNGKARESRFLSTATAPDGTTGVALSESMRFGS